MADFSFDITCDYNAHEMTNALDQTTREITGRYDLQGSGASIEWSSPQKTSLTIKGDHDLHIESIEAILRKKMAARQLDQKLLDTTKDTVVSGRTYIKDVLIKQTLPVETSKKVIALIRSEFPKCKPSIQGDTVRVSSPKKDELQMLMNYLRGQDLEYPLQFGNYR
jgi:cyclic-di-GMP-binding protein